MKHLVTALVLLTAFPLPLAAQDEETDGYSLMQEGARLLMQGLMAEMEPTLEDLRALADDMGPALTSLMAAMGPAFIEMFRQVDDFAYYEPPVFLENGDILIRRREDAPPFTPPETEPPEIDL